MTETAKIQVTRVQATEFQPLQVSLFIPIWTCRFRVIAKNPINGRMQNHEAQIVPRNNASNPRSGCIRSRG